MCCMKGAEAIPFRQEGEAQGQDRHMTPQLEGPQRLFGGFGCMPYLYDS